MKIVSRSRAALSIAALSAIASLPSIAFAGGSSEPSPAVALSEGDCDSSSCVMVFARVGERFRYDLPLVQNQSDAECSVGKDVNGERSSLPEGLVFNAEKGSLEGVPLRSGFHEFVVLRTEADETREQVVLIDIQGHAFAGGGVDYAAYVAGGIR